MTPLRSPRRRRFTVLQAISDPFTAKELGHYTLEPWGYNDGDLVEKLEWHFKRIFKVKDAAVHVFCSLAGANDREAHCASKAFNHILRNTKWKLRIFGEASRLSEVLKKIAGYERRLKAGAIVPTAGDGQWDASAISTLLSLQQNIPTTCIIAPIGPQSDWRGSLEQLKDALLKPKSARWIVSLEGLRYDQLLGSSDVASRVIGPALVTVLGDRRLSLWENGLLTPRWNSSWIAGEFKKWLLLMKQREVPADCLIPWVRQLLGKEGTKLDEYHALFRILEVAGVSNASALKGQEELTTLVERCFGFSFRLISKIYEKGHFLSELERRHSKALWPCHETHLKRLGGFPTLDERINFWLALTRKIPPQHLTTELVAKAIRQYSPEAPLNPLDSPILDMHPDLMDNDFDAEDTIPS